MKSYVLRMEDDTKNTEHRLDFLDKGYKQKWSHSGEYDDNDDDNASADSEELQTYSTLPPFADDECISIYRATLELDAKCDRKSRHTKQITNRLKTMRDHLQHIRQEIDLTNSLIIADKDGVRAEEHLVALGEREKAKLLAEIKDIDRSLVLEQSQLKGLEMRKARAIEETESLKLSLNCNQEELEQWAKSVAMKETDYLTLEKYTRADDVKIKDLTMKLETMTMQSLAKKIELENECMETQNHKLELDRVLKMFQKEQMERKSMISQLQETVEYIKKRDYDIQQISMKYSDLELDLDQKLCNLIKMRRIIEEQKINNVNLMQSLSVSERDLITKQQDLTNLQQNHHDMLDEFDLLRIDSKAAAISLKKVERDYKLSEDLLSEKRRHLQKYHENSDIIRKQLTEETQTTAAHGFSTQDMQQRLKEKEKEFKNTENILHTLKDQLFRDSKALDHLHKVEIMLLSEIASTKASGKNLSTKLKLLEDQQLKQNDNLHKVSFQVANMEKKVARGLGERSDEEKRHLIGKISELENELSNKVEMKKKLTQQCKDSQIALKDWRKRKHYSKTTSIDIQNRMTALALDISSYDQCIKLAYVKKKETALFHDSVRLEMTRLRNSLAKKITEEFELRDMKEQSLVNATKEKERLIMQKEIRHSELKLAREDLHKATIEAGRKCITAQTMKTKYETICTNGEPCDEKSHIKSLVALAQKQAELQQEGDKIDQELTKRESGIKSLQTILRSLRANNLEIRRSLVTIPPKVIEKHESYIMASELLERETALYELKEKLRIVLLKYEHDGKESELLAEKKKNLEEEYERLSIFKDNVIEEMEQLIDS